MRERAKILSEKEIESYKSQIITKDTIEIQTDTRKKEHNSF